MVDEVGDSEVQRRQGEAEIQIDYQKRRQALVVTYGVSKAFVEAGSNNI